MSRLERKCLVASGGLHLFLVLLVLFGSAFFKARKIEPPLQMLNVVPSRLIDEALAGGGGNPNLPRTNERIKGETLNPTAAPPAPAPEPPKARPPQPKADVPPPRPEPVKPPIRTAEAPPKMTKQSIKEATEPVKPKADQPVKRVIDLSELKPISRDDSAKEREKVRKQAEARAAAAARERAQKAAAFSEQLQRERNSSLSGLRRGFNDGTKVDVGGPGGAAFANYKMFVQMAYDNAWVVTPELTDADLVALIKVTISRSGRVLSSRIVRPSGSALMDRTVQRAMDRVRADGLPAFPPESPDAERTFTIEFNLKSKSRTG